MAQRKRSVPGLFFVLAIGLAACGGGGDDDGDNGDGDSGDGDAPGVDGGIIGDPSCGAPDLVGMGSACEDPPCLAAPEYGFQVRSVGTMIQPQEDV